MFHFDIIHVKRNAEKPRGQALGCDTKHSVVLKGLHWNPLVLDFQNAGSTGQKMHQEAFGLDGVICVVGVHAFVVIGEYGVVDSEFCEHGMIHDELQRNGRSLVLQTGSTPHRPPPPRTELRCAEVLFMKTKTKTEKTTAKPYIPISRDDRARTNAGKTVNSKVRSEGRTLAAMERGALAQRIYKAEEAKTRALE